jgi:hypothetical protein
MLHKNGAAVTFGLESANIVGYQEKTTVSGFNFYTPTFKQVGGAEKTYSIQDIKLDEATATSYADNIQILDEGGATISQYFWVGPGMLLADKACWTEDFGTPAEVNIDSGTSFIIQTTNPSKITVAGEVLKGNLTFTSVMGFNFVGNSAPTSYDIQEIKLDEATATSYADNIQILDEGGATVAQYFWVGTGMLLADKPCWTEDFGTPATVNIDPGLGFIVQTSAAGVTITLPSVNQ